MKSRTQFGLAIAIYFLGLGVVVALRRPTGFLLLLSSALAYLLAVLVQSRTAWRGTVVSFDTSGLVAVAKHGLPLTLFHLDETHQAAVLEMGMSRRGELSRLAEIARPDVGVVTRVAPAHLEFFSGVEEIALAKRELIDTFGQTRLLKRSTARTAAAFSSPWRPASALR